MTAPKGGMRTGRSFRARPRLFVSLCVIFALWMAALLVLYFTTVYPRRHPPHSGVQIPTILQK